MASMINVQSPEELIAEEQAQTLEVEDAFNTPLLDGLTTLILDRWEKAKTAKDPIQRQMLVNLRQKRGIYEAAKLAAIKGMGGSEAYIKLTDTKCRNGKAWVKDILFQPGMKPWSIEPTPVPELDPDTEQGIAAGIINQSVEDMVNESLAAGLPPDMAMIQQSVTSNMDALKDVITAAVKEKARENAKKVMSALDDQLIEGGWYKALDQVIDDVIDQKAGFLKGPSFRKIKKRKLVPKPDGGMVVIYTDEPSPIFERRSPFDIYPAPDAVDVNDGYLFDRLSLTRRDLLNLRGVEGYKTAAIDEILEQTVKGTPLNWLNLEYTSEQLEALGQDTSSMWAGEKIDCLEFWGVVNGQTLLDFDDEIGADGSIDPIMDYDVCAWVIDKYVIKCMLNYDTMGRKPFFKASFEEEQDTFWGTSVPEKIDDIQGACCAVVRAMLNNVGIASGPQIEINMDRVPAGTSTVLWPLRVWPTTESTMMTNSPALKVYNITMNADKLIAVYNHLSKLADDHCGIPSYESGQSQSGGGAQGTASGLSMLMTAAARGIKSVIRSIDMEIIAPSIEFLFFWNLDNGKLNDIICDMNIEAKGSSSLIAREQQAVRINEFLQTTMNPTDLQILGLEGRKDLLVQAAKASEITVKNLENFKVPLMQTAQMPGDPNAPQQPAGPAQPPGAPQPAPKNVDSAGNASQGQDQRLFKQDQVPQQRT